LDIGPFKASRGVASVDQERRAASLFSTHFNAAPSRRQPSHAVAGKYLLAALAQLGPVLLQALLYRSIITQLLAAKALRIASAGLLLLRRAHVTLCQG
jgi:hypothetical protein